jgi:hypothetical protein
MVQEPSHVKQLSPIHVCKIGARSRTQVHGCISNTEEKGKTMDASNRRTNNRRNPCISMGASNSMNKGKSMDASNRRTNNRRNPCISMGASATA